MFFSILHCNWPHSYDIFLEYLFWIFPIFCRKKARYRSWNFFTIYIREKKKIDYWKYEKFEIFTLAWHKKYLHIQNSNKWLGQWKQRFCKQMALNHISIIPLWKIILENSVTIFWSDILKIHTGMAYNTKTITCKIA